MVFSSLTFLFFFLPLYLIGLRLTDGTPAKIPFLTALSLAFYAWGEPLFLAVMLASIVGNWWVALRLERASSGALLFWAILGNLALLALLKYAGFLAGIAAALMPVPAAVIAFAERIPLPIGISFFTFQSISYLVDVRRRETPAQPSCLTYAAYISAFPQLIAGPIVRYSEVRRDLESPERTPVEEVWAGLQVFATGLMLKVCLANPAGAVADSVFGVAPATLTTASAWLGISCYFVQIFFDFSGYSTMAIGLGRCAGLRFPENFAAPYRARSITEFWRRWHQTLSSFFRDYVYIPLGGNRCGALRTYLNLVIVFLLCGLWHGAAWTFVAWGAFHGLLLLLERVAGIAGRPLPAPFGQAYTFLLVCAGWVLFRASSLPEALAYYQALLGVNTAARPLAEFAGPAIGVVLGIAALVLYVPLDGVAGRLPRLRPFTLATGSALSVWLLVAGTHNPFIYFRF